LTGQDLPAGVHINAIGANHAHKQELDANAIAKANLIFVDSLAQSKQEAGDLIIPFQQQPQRWNDVHELSELVAGKTPGRTTDLQITLFKSNGIAAWDLAVAEKVFALAQQNHLGRQLPLFSAGP
jgi:ornithine cyclodeaminase/alanine dehydrogenase-like protein (mu-crystallin family)